MVLEIRRDVKGGTELGNVFSSSSRRRGPGLRL